MKWYEWKMVEKGISLESYKYAQGDRRDMLKFMHLLEVGIPGSSTKIYGSDEFNNKYNRKWDRFNGKKDVDIKVQ